MKKSLTKMGFFIFLYLLVFESSSALSQNVKIWIEPPQTNVKVGDDFTIEVVVDSVVNLGAFQLNIEYPSKLIKADSAWLGTFLGRSGRQVSSVGPDIDNISATGSVRFGGFSLGSTPPGPNGIGVLALVKFTTHDTGTATLDLKDVQIVDVNGQTQSVNSIADGQVIIESQMPQVDPSKTTVTAWPDTIPADGSSISTITVTPKNSLGSSLGSGLDVNLTTTAGTLLASVDDNGDGTYTQMLQSSTTPGAAVITATVNGIEMNQKPKVMFIPLTGIILKIEPADTAVEKGESFTVDISIINVTNLGSFQFTIQYPTHFITGDSAWLDPFLASTGRAVNPLGPIIDNTAVIGEIIFGAFSIGTSDGPSGSGVLAKVKFTTLNTGRAILDLRDVQVTDINGNLLPVTLVIDGYTSIITKIVNSSETILPKKFFLWPNYPNPFNPKTAIRYQLLRNCHVTLEIYNSVGQRICSLVDQWQPAGYYTVRWNGKDEHRHPVGSGVYLYRLQASEFVQVRKMILIR